MTPSATPPPLTAAQRLQIKLRGQRAAQEKARRHQLRPLAYARPWTPRCVECSYPLTEVRHPQWRCTTPGCVKAELAEKHTSQRHVFADLGVDATAVLGGNGSGKTQLGAQIAVATALGRQDPGARAWAEAVGFPLERLPDRATGGRVLASALTSNDSKRVLRSQRAGKIPAYLPAGSVWRNQDGDGEAKVTLPNGGEIIFKSNDQGRRGYQGDWYDLVWLDEEHDADVFEECEVRVARVPGGGGWILLTMTPLKGYTWVYDRFITEARPTDRFHYLDGLENPWIPLDKTKRMLNGLSAARRAARRFGHFTALEGLVYNDFNREPCNVLDEETMLPTVHPNTNVCWPFEIPAAWRRYRAIDFGVRDPWVCLWIAVDPSDDIAYVYRELYDTTKRGTKKNGAEVVRLSKADPDIDELGGWTVADSADKNSRITLQEECEIYTLRAIKDIAEGIAEVNDRIRVDADGKVHLVFFATCKNSIREHEQLKWRKDTGGPNGAPATPEDRDNHTCVAGWTLLATADGMQPIASLAGQEVPVWAMTAAGPRVTPGIVVDMGESDVLEIVTEDGRRLVCTPDHPLLTPEGWALARDLSCGDTLTRTDTMRYANDSGSGCGVTDDSGVEREQVLPVRSVLREHRVQPEAPASGRLVRRARPSTARLPRPPQGREQDEQRTLEPGVRSEASAPLGAHDAGAPRNGGRPAGPARAPRSFRLAPIGGGARGAPRDVEAGVGGAKGAGAGARDAVRALRRDGGDVVAGPEGLLRQPVQDRRAPGAAEAGDERRRPVPPGHVWSGDDARALSAMAAEGRNALPLACIVSVRPAGRTRVYNLEVPGAHTYVTDGGLISHNCDAARYWAYLYRRRGEGSEGREEGAPRRGGRADGEGRGEW